MNPDFLILPDSVFNALVISGAVLAAVFVTLADEVKVFRIEKAARERKPAVKKAETPQSLADYYTAAAYGDFEDEDYWAETAEQFKENA